MNYLERLKSQLNNPMIKLEAEEIIKEINEQPNTELLNNIKFQLSSPTFLREWCINEIEIELRKQK